MRVRANIRPFPLRIVNSRALRPRVSFCASKKEPSGAAAADLFIPGYIRRPTWKEKRIPFLSATPAALFAHLSSPPQSEAERAAVVSDLLRSESWDQEVRPEFRVVAEEMHALCWAVLASRPEMVRDLRTFQDVEAVDEPSHWQAYLSVRRRLHAMHLGLSHLFSPFLSGKTLDLTSPQSPRPFGELKIPSAKELERLTPFEQVLFIKHVRVASLEYLFAMEENPALGYGLATFVVETFMDRAIDNLARAQKRGDTDALTEETMRIFLQEFIEPESAFPDFGQLRIPEGILRRMGKQKLRRGSFLFPGMAFPQEASGVFPFMSHALTLFGLQAVTIRAIQNLAKPRKGKETDSFFLFGRLGSSDEIMPYLAELNRALQIVSFVPDKNQTMLAAGVLTASQIDGLFCFSPPILRGPKGEDSEITPEVAMNRSGLLSSGVEMSIFEKGNVERASAILLDPFYIGTKAHGERALLTGADGMGTARDICMFYALMQQAEKQEVRAGLLRRFGPLFFADVDPFLLPYAKGSALGEKMLQFTNGKGVVDQASAAIVQTTFVDNNPGCILGHFPLVRVANQEIPLQVDPHRLEIVMELMEQVMGALSEKEREGISEPLASTLSGGEGEEIQATVRRTLKKAKRQNPSGRADSALQRAQSWNLHIVPPGLRELANGPAFDFDQGVTTFLLHWDTLFQVGRGLIRDEESLGDLLSFDLYRLNEEALVSDFRQCFHVLIGSKTVPPIAAWKRELEEIDRERDRFFYLALKRQALKRGWVVANQEGLLVASPLGLEVAGRETPLSRLHRLTQHDEVPRITPQDGLYRLSPFLHLYGKPGHDWGDCVLAHDGKEGLSYLIELDLMQKRGEAATREDCLAAFPTALLDGRRLAARKDVKVIRRGAIEARIPEAIGGLVLSEKILPPDRSALDRLRNEVQGHFGPDPFGRLFALEVRHVEGRQGGVVIEGERVVLENMELGTGQPVIRSICEALLARASDEEKTRLGALLQRLADCEEQERVMQTILTAVEAGQAGALRAAIESAFSGTIGLAYTGKGSTTVPFESLFDRHGTVAKSGVFACLAPAGRIMDALKIPFPWKKSKESEQALLTVCREGRCYLFHPVTGALLSPSVIEQYRSMAALEERLQFSLAPYLSFSCWEPVPFQTQLARIQETLDSKVGFVERIGRQFPQAPAPTRAAINEILLGILLEAGFERFSHEDFSRCLERLWRSFGHTVTALEFLTYCQTTLRSYVRARKETLTDGAKMASDLETIGESAFAIILARVDKGLSERIVEWQGDWEERFPGLDGFAVSRVLFFYAQVHEAGDLFQDMFPVMMVRKKEGRREIAAPLGSVGGWADHIPPTWRGIFSDIPDGEAAKGALGVQVAILSHLLQDRAPIQRVEVVSPDGVRYEMRSKKFQTHAVVDLHVSADQIRLQAGEATLTLSPCGQDLLVHVAGDAEIFLIAPNVAFEDLRKETERWRGGLTR